MLNIILRRSGHRWGDQLQTRHLQSKDGNNAADRKRALFLLKNRLSEAYKARLKSLVTQISRANDKYNDFVGLSDVQDAQKKVKEAESTFLEARAKERIILREMVSTRDKLKHVRERLSHVDYSNKMYLQLASEQHELVTQEERQKTELEEAEDDERDSFSSLSNAMRESYERERDRVERTKNWSVIGTVFGTIMGMLGSIYMNRMRTKDLMKAVRETGDKADLSATIQALATGTEQNQQTIATAINALSDNVGEMNDALQVQNMQALSGFVNDSLSDQRTSTTIGETASNRRTSSANQISLRVLSDEIEQYNKALISLSNAVVALTNADTHNASGSSKTHEYLEKLLENSKATSLKIDDLFSSHQSNVNHTIDKTMHRSQAMENPSFIDENSDTCDAKLNWRVGVKDVALWGSALCFLYYLIQF